MALATSGYTIVSGLARGTDLEAHLGALEAGGTTVAVLPGPVTDIYPPEHDRLADDIVANGAVVSEVSPLEGMTKMSFIRRNRITSGLSIALVLCESDGTGGSLQQFQVARKQGRPVFVLRPKERSGIAMKGFERFSREGAIPIDEAEDLIARLEKGIDRQSGLGDFAER